MCPLKEYNIFFSSTFLINRLLRGYIYFHWSIFWRYFHPDWKKNKFSGWGVPLFVQRPVEGYPLVKKFFFQKMYNKHPTWLSEKSSFDLKFVKIKKFFFKKILATPLDILEKLIYSLVTIFLTLKIDFFLTKVWFLQGTEFF